MTDDPFVRGMGILGSLARPPCRTDRAELYPHDLPFGGCRSTRSRNTIA